jgi:hypothetical protein
MGIPNTARDTGTTILGIRTLTDELIPNCSRCFVMSGHHERTKEIGYFAFCKKSGKLEKVGPYKSYYEALKNLTLTKGCDSCGYNKLKEKDDYLPLLTEKFKKEMQSLYGKDEVTITMSPVQSFVEYRKHLDVNFEARFGIKLFIPIADDPVAAVDLIKPCNKEKDFIFKIQALAGLIDRINGTELKNKIMKKEKDSIKGSINILQQFLIENFQHYPRHIVSNLRNLLTLRSKMYPAHATSAEIIVVLRNFGIDKYPLDDWERGFVKIMRLCANSLADLITLVQSKG